MSNFEWHTEDEYGWDDEPQQQNSAETNPRRRILSALLLLFIVATAAFFVYRQAQATVQEAVTETETELAATVALFNRAAATGDLELMRSLLSGADPEWARDMQLRAGSENLLDRSLFGMALVSAEPRATNISLSPDLFSAQVTSTVAYAIDVGNGLTETVLLDQPAIYRQGETRWLLAPPEDTAYWGDARLRYPDIGSVTMAQRDHEIIDRLLADIDIIHKRICAGESVCLKGNPTYSFSTSPSVAMTVQPLIDWSLEPPLVTLPTPSLTGLPTTELAYEALLAGYARIMIRANLQHALSSEMACCTQTLQFDALLDQLLAQHGLIADSFSAENYRSAFEYADAGFQARSFNRGTPYTSDELIATRIWLDYAADTLGVTYFDMLRLLPTANDAGHWVQQMAAFRTPNVFTTPADTFMDAHFESYRQHLSQLIPLEASLPPDLTLPQISWACDEETGSTLYTPDGQSTYFQDRIELIRALPDGSGVWVAFDMFDSLSQSLIPTYLWRNGELTQISDRRLNWLGEVSPDQQQLYLRAPFRTGEGGSAAIYGFFALDLATCHSGDCPLERLLGSPQWSPNEAHTLYLNLENELRVTNANGDTVDEQVGFSAFWQSADSYVFQTSTTEYVRRQIGSAESEAWLSFAEVIAPIGDTVNQTNPYLSLQPHPQDAQTVFATMFGLADERLVAVHNRALGTTQTLPTVSDAHLRKVSPDGNYLLLSRTYRPDGLEFASTLLLVDWQDGQTWRIPDATSQKFHWLDGEETWAAIDQGDFVQVMAPARNYMTLIPAPAANCVSAAIAS